MKLGRSFSETVLSRIVTVVVVPGVLLVIPIAFGISSANKATFPFLLKINRLN